MVKSDDLELAFEFVSADAAAGNEAYLCRETGVIYWHSEFGDDFEELPDDIDTDRYIAIPHKNQLNLGKQLVLSFAADVLPDQQSEIREIFGRRGAYARFKGLLQRCGKLQQWHDYEAAAQREALQKWCNDNHIDIDG